MTKRDRKKRMEEGLTPPDKVERLNRFRTPGLQTDTHQRNPDQHHREKERSSTPFVIAYSISLLTSLSASATEITTLGTYFGSLSRRIG
jgi:hypothetical protein